MKLTFHVLTVFLFVFTFEPCYHAKPPVVRVVDTAGKAVDELRGAIGINLPPGRICSTCTVAATIAKRAFVSQRVTRVMLYEVCKQFIGLKRNVCLGLAETYSPTIYHIMKYSKLSPTDMCAVAVHPDCANGNFSQFVKWTLPLPEERGTNFPTEDYDLSLRGKRILHLSDIHYDPLYLPGSVADCDEPLCCRNESTGGKKRAGYWGHYENCDVPLHTVKGLISHLSTSHRGDYDLIYWTGDNSPHDTWKVSVDELLNTTKTITGLLLSKLSADKSIFAALGNHEGIPTDQFALVDKGYPTRLIFWEISHQWSSWLGSDEAVKTFQYGGYFTRNVTRKLKLISLNTNVCERLNLWNIYNPIDPFEQLQWFVRELHKSELSGQYVHIIGHLPPDTHCTASWLHNYIRIITRFGRIIKGQFFGHHHADIFKIYYNGGDNDKPVGVAYIGPSVTSFNPSYRFYVLNPDASVNDTETYFMNLTEANANGIDSVMNWRKEYAARSAYNLRDLTPISWDELYKKMEADDSLVQSYYKYSHRFSDNMPSQCDAGCKVNLLNAIGQRDWFLGKALNVSPAPR